MYSSSEPRLQWLSLMLLVFLVPLLPGFTVHQRSEPRPLNPNMEVEERKKQSISSSTFEAVLVKEQYVANKGEIPARGRPVLYSPPSHIGKHVMSTAPLKVHGGEYVSLDKGPVPPSAPNPITHGP